MRPGLRPTGLGSPPVRVCDAGRWRSNGVGAGPIRQRAGGDGGTTAASAQFITRGPRFSFCFYFSCLKFLEEIWRRVFWGFLEGKWRGPLWNIFGCYGKMSRGRLWQKRNLGRGFLGE